MTTVPRQTLHTLVQQVHRWCTGHRYLVLLSPPARARKSTNMEMSSGFSTLGNTMQRRSSRALGFGIQWTTLTLTGIRVARSPPTTLMPHSDVRSSMTSCSS